MTYEQKQDILDDAYTEMCDFVKSAGLDPDNFHIDKELEEAFLSSEEGISCLRYDWEEPGSLYQYSIHVSGQKLGIEQLRRSFLQGWEYYMRDLGWLTEEERWELLS